MLSYQHIYHAGCLPDIHKHMALAELFDLMVKKDKPLTYVETHAGRGYYDLKAPEAQKTGEAAEGIERMLKEEWFLSTRPFMRVLNSAKRKKGKNIYPGSAAIAEHYRRPGDKFHLMELHPGEIKHLHAAFNSPAISIQKKDGMAALLALAPPEPRRGLVFIDPSYEIKSEYDTLPGAISKLMKKWPVAVPCLWYPLLPSQSHKSMIRSLTELNLPKSGIFEVEFCPPPPRGNGWKSLYGSGLFIANIPHGFEQRMEEIEKRLTGIKNTPEKNQQL